MTKAEFKQKVVGKTKEELQKLGFRKWNNDSKLMLIPGKLFKSIPEGIIIFSISGKKEKFNSKTSDNDTRFGCLAYGIMHK